MRRFNSFRIIASLLLAFTSLAAPLPVSAQTPAQTPTARESTAQILKRLGGKPCPDSDFTCVTLTVPLDHFNPSDPRTIKIVFAILPATGKRRGLFVTATGGPGTSGLAAADSYTAAFDPSIRRRFDIIFFDQRGIAASGGLTCPTAAATYYQSEARTDTPQQEAALKNAAHTFADDCVSEMGAPTRLPYLGTAQAVEDLETFRQLLHDDQFWLYGESYGTQYAQTYAAAHPDHLAGLILDGTVDLTLTGIEFYVQQAQAFNDVLGLTQQACNDDPVCAGDSSGDALAAYDQLAARLKHAPVSYRFPLPSGGLERRDFTFGNLETIAAGQMYRV